MGQATTNKENNSDGSLVLAAASAAVISVVAAGGGYYCYYHHRYQRNLRQELNNMEERRQEERRGRIRAEQKLRSLSKEHEALQLTNEIKKQQQKQQKNHAGQEHEGHQLNDNDNLNENDNMMVLKCIGTVVSPFTKRMGTPRQGALVPSSRAYIQLLKNTAPCETLDGIELYSHLWIVFAFHANTNVAADSKKTKVRPPRADRKVGQLATRSPHRPNPLGLSLVKMEQLDTKLKRLHISALDLVNGTPVYDIKPCVPWDIPGYHDQPDKTSINIREALKVPHWVEQNDVMETVQFTPQAEESLKELLMEGRLAPLYTQQNDSDAAGAIATLKEILAQDPRSSHKGLKENKRGTTTAKTYALVFGQTQVEFQVSSDRGVQVEKVIPIDFKEEAFVEGIPLMSEQLQAN